MRSNLQRIGGFSKEELEQVCLSIVGMEHPFRYRNKAQFIGTISLFLSQKAKQVYGVEIVTQAIEDAKNNAALNGITNAEFFCGKSRGSIAAVL